MSELAEADANAAADRINNLQPPSPRQIDPCTGNPVEFTTDQFNAARTELVKELRWVGNVRSYLTKLASPFDDGALTSWVAVQTIADQIYLDARKPEGDAGLRWTQFTQIILKLLGPLTDGATGHMANLMEFGVWLARAGKHGAPGGDDPRFAADELGAKLVAQAQQAEASYTRMGDIIVSDYAKLS